ncbi:mRNA-capping enzyme-like isoform X2 [Ruditapes philippinarum]|uniref:mRNA-capping enzyme-like isoform X2 n=1 Tax=Ruditapes philippinarum TaxID=129788 RepID=UPI00295B783E|nr:mRNA-capping enzyme-like isoform X2 [Ruditapes philippinarum]
MPCARYNWKGQSGSKSSFHRLKRFYRVFKLKNRKMPRWKSKSTRGQSRSATRSRGRRSHQTETSMQPIVEQPVTNTHVPGVLGQQSLYPQGAVPSMASVSENFASTSHGGQMMSTAGEMFESPVVGQPPRVHETSVSGVNIVTPLNLDPPNYWLKCPQKGDIIIDKFIPFKTPLDSKFVIDLENRFDFDELLKSLENPERNLGLVVDLTNTNKYYDSNAVMATGCEYVKIQCIGHGATPSKEQTAQFIQICDRFIERKPNKIIGVHCTHGFNRTGFLIIAYMIERLNYSLNNAVQCFAEARPQGIYKQTYLRELYDRYKKEGDTLPVSPGLPEWHDETD